MGSTRRGVLRTAAGALALALAGCSGDANDTDGSPTGTPSTTKTPETTSGSSTGTASTSTTTKVTINNVGRSAWKVTEGGGTIAPAGVQNPTMTFRTGTRYEIENQGWSIHPFALRTAGDDPLLSQSADGSYESDAAVNWVDEGDRFAFTMTDELSADVDYYTCTVHSPMRGDVTTS